MNSFNSVNKSLTTKLPEFLFNVTSGSFTKTISGSYTCYTFTSSSTVNIRSVKSKTLHYLCVAGGGAGGFNSGGGGGAGGVLQSTIVYTSLVADTLTLTVGDGGIYSGGWPPSASDLKGKNSSIFSSKTIFTTVTSIGGGNGAFENGVGSSYNNPTDGGSGGGLAIRNVTTGQGTSGQGFNGGPFTGIYAGSGGGGAGGVGIGTSTNFNGGVGKVATSPISLVYSYYWGGGGGGGIVQSHAAAGGSGGLGGGGGGGNGAGAYPGLNTTGTAGSGGGSAYNSGGNGNRTVVNSYSDNGGHGGANTGGGGGGGGQFGTGGNGGSGIIVIMFLT